MGLGFNEQFLASPEGTKLMGFLCISIWARAAAPPLARLLGLWVLCDRWCEPNSLGTSLGREAFGTRTPGVSHPRTPLLGRVELLRSFKMGLPLRSIIPGAVPRAWFYHSLSCLWLWAHPSLSSPCLSNRTRALVPPHTRGHTVHIGAPTVFWFVFFIFWRKK